MCVVWYVQLVLYYTKVTTDVSTIENVQLLKAVPTTAYDPTKATSNAQSYAVAVADAASYDQRA